MGDPKLLKIFDKLKPKDTVQLKVSSGISKGKDFQTYVVKSKGTVRRGEVEKVTLYLQGNPTGVKRFLYKKDGKVTFAIGDMGASIDDIKEDNSEQIKKLEKMVEEQTDIVIELSKDQNLNMTSLASRERRQEENYKAIIN